MSTDNMFRWDQDDAGIVTLTMDDPNAPVNTMNKTFQDDIRATVERLENEIGDGSGTSIKGIIILSLIHISEPTRRLMASRMPSSA